VDEVHPLLHAKNNKCTAAGYKLYYNNCIVQSIFEIWNDDHVTCKHISDKIDEKNSHLYCNLNLM